MSTAPGASLQPPAPPQTGGGSKVLLWILGIFVGFVLFVMVSCAAIGFYIAHKAKQYGNNPVYAVTRMAVAANRDLELISSDDSAGTMTIRDRRTGKVGTLKFDPVRKTMVAVDQDGKSASFRFDPNKQALVVTNEDGRTATISAEAQGDHLEVKSDDGTVKLDTNADQTPNSIPAYPGAAPQNNLSANDGKNAGGAYVFFTKDPVDKVLTYYSDTLKSSGYKISSATSNSNGKAGGMVSAASEGDKRTVLVTASDESEGTKVSVTYTDRK